VMSAPAPTQPQSDIHARTHTHTISHNHRVTHTHTHTQSHMLSLSHTQSHSVTCIVLHMLPPHMAYLCPTRLHVMACTSEWSLSCHDHYMMLTWIAQLPYMFMCCWSVVAIMHVATTHGIPQSHTVTCHGTYI
jgi:hypothetical protein